MGKLVVYGAVLLAAVAFLSGCATMFTDKTQKISFKTKPDKAEVAVGTKTCITPCTLEIDKGKWNLHVMVTKDGYAPQSTVLIPKVEPIAFANFFNLGIGFIVDMATGTLVKYEPEYYIPLARK